MNIDVVGRIRPSLRGEGPQTLAMDGYNKIASQPGGTYYSFQQVHSPDTTNYEVYKQSIEPLLGLWLAGYNTAVIVAGESNAGKSFTFAGESTSKAGIVPMFFDNFFASIGEGSFHHDTSSRANKRVDMQMYEIHNELIRDLFRVQSSKSGYVEIDETPNLGAHVKDIKVCSVNSAEGGITQFRQAWSRKSSNMTDFGAARNHSAIVLHLDLTLRNNDSPLPNKSRMTFVLTPGAEKLTEDVSQLRLREGPVLSKSIVSLNQLCATLADHPYPNRAVSYSDSQITRLLREEFGGNCKTRVIVCFKPNNEPVALAPILRFCGQLTRVQNYPIVNDPLAQQLLTQYRARIEHLQSQLGINASHPTHTHDLSDEMRRIQTDNLQLRDKNERLHQKLDQMQGQFGAVASSKTDLSAQLLMTEEEKLKVSKTLVEMQIENNSVKEDAEAAKFELTNKILQLESALMQATMEKERQIKTTRNAHETISELEKDRKDLADEYVVLKTNYLNTNKAFRRVQERNQELGVELVNLANAKAAIMRQFEKRDLTLQASEEIGRVKELVARLSTHKLRPEDFGDRDEVEKSLFGGERRYKSELDRMTHTHNDDQQRQERRLNAAQKELSDVRKMTREKQKKMSELNAQLITARSLVQSLESQNNRLQHKLKDVNDEFRSRLVKYVQDIAEYVDNGGVPGNKKDTREMKGHVDAMLRDLKKSHKVREDQLSQAAQSYRRLAEKTTRKHEELLVAYRDLRQQVQDRHLESVILGPDEHTLQMTDSELTSEQQKIINRLRQDYNQAHNELEALQLRARMEGSSKVMPFAPGKRTGKGDSDEENWSSLRKQLREFSVNTQQELEQERAELLSKNAMMEQEVLDLQTYIDSHLAKYRDEILRLREAAGGHNSGGFVSPGAPSRYMPRKDRR